MIIFYKNINLKSENKNENTKNNIFKDLKTIFLEKRQLFYLTVSEGFFAALTPYLFFFLNVHLISNGADVLFIYYLAAIIYFFRIIGSIIIKKFYHIKKL